MPWTNQSGRGGGDGRGPWGGGGPSSGQAPDLEELLKRSQDRLKKVLPPGFGLKGRGGLVLLLIVAVVWLLSGTYQVDRNEQGVVTRFGRFEGTTGAGLHYRLPWPIESVEIVDVTGARQINIGYTTSEDSQALQDVAAESHMLTGDENIVDVNFSVFWVVRDAPAFLFNVEDPESAIKAVAESAMREVAGRSRIENMMTGDRQSIQNGVQKLMQTILDSYGAGVTISRVNLQKVDPPDQVIEAYRDVQAARANMEQKRNEGLAYANQVVPQARGEAARIVRGAEGYKQRVIAEAQGEAARFNAIYEQYKLAPDVTRRRIYIETMEGILARMNKVIVDGRGSQGVLPYMPLPELRRGEVQPRGSAGDQP
jgi:membrane protease subunit HflK